MVCYCIPCISMWEPLLCPEWSPRFSLYPLGGWQQVVRRSVSDMPKLIGHAQAATPGASECCRQQCWCPVVYESTNDLGSTFGNLMLHCCCSMSQQVIPQAAHVKLLRAQVKLVKMWLHPHTGSTSLAIPRNTGVLDVNKQGLAVVIYSHTPLKMLIGVAEI